MILDTIDRMVEKIRVHNSLVDSIVLVPRLYYYYCCCWCWCWCCFCCCSSSSWLFGFAISFKFI